MEINQFLPTIAPRDAIGNEVFEIRKILTNWGYRSEIYAENIHPSLKAKQFTNYSKKASENNIALFHFSVGSDISYYVKNLPDKKIIRYHGITPPQYLTDTNQYLMELLRQGREQLLSFPSVTQLALANSRYTEIELQEMKFGNTAVLPLIINFEVYKKFNEDILLKYNDDYVNIIFTGRIIPQKRQDDLIKIFYYYQKINPKSRLILIGNADNFESYYTSLLDLIKKLQIKNVIFTGSISTEALVAYYKLADIFLCMSEWETFCVPLVESMYFNVPIIANNSTAIPYTLGDAGILVNNKNYCEIAELIDVITNDDTLKMNLINKQKNRLKALTYEKTKEKFRQIINNLTDNAK
jgi:glycosyltransferase involved in cell wall biosynthesis